MAKFHNHKVFAPHLTDTSLLPSAVGKCYGFPDPTTLDLKDRSASILELGGAYQIQDVINYCNANGYKVPTITNVFLDGATAISDPNGADGEVALDICIIAAVAQAAHIYVVFSSNTDQGFIDGVAKCVEPVPGVIVDVISVSWGGPLSTWDPASITAMDKVMFDAANIHGTATCVASGDNGSDDGTGSPDPDYPACSPYAIACGGTKLTLNSDGTRKSETAWSTQLFDDSGSGGGVATNYPTPKWQEGILPNLPAGRRSPDIAGNADPNSGYQIEIDGQSAQVGGTSAVAPLMAALFLMANAKANKHIGNLHTKLYSAPASMLYDVTQGTNGTYSAEKGYDCVTGLGVINADVMLGQSPF